MMLQERVAELLDLVGLLPTMPPGSRMNFPGASASGSVLRGPSRLSPTDRSRRACFGSRCFSPAQIVNLLADLQATNLTYVFIAHDLSVVRQVSTRIAVMYLGSVVELGQADYFCKAGTPLYPSPDFSRTGAGSYNGDPEPHRFDRRRAKSINPPSGCRFHPRCPIAQERCKVERPLLLRQRFWQASCLPLSTLELPKAQLAL